MCSWYECIWLDTDYCVLACNDYDNILKCNFFLLNEFISIYTCINFFQLSWTKSYWGLLFSLSDDGCVIAKNLREISSSETWNITHLCWDLMINFVFHTTVFALPPKTYPLFILLVVKLLPTTVQVTLEYVAFSYTIFTCFSDTETDICSLWCITY